MIGINGALLFFGDVAVFIAALFLALMVRYRAWPSDAVLYEHLESFMGVFIVWGIVFLIAGLYDARVNLSRKRIPVLIIQAQFVNLALATAVFFVFPVGITPKVTLVLYGIISTALIAFWRLFIFPYLASKRALHALIVGGGEEADALLRILNTGEFFTFISAQKIDPEAYADQGTFATALHERVAKGDVSLVIGDTLSSKAGKLVASFFDIAFLNRHAMFLSLHQVFEQIFHRIPPSMVHDSWLLENVSMQPHALYDVAKRIFDIGGALILGICTLPLYPLIMLAIYLDDHGPFFYRTERVGKYNHTIHLIKFRTKNGQDVGQQALQSTLVVTRVGGFLRKTRLDELPQVWNILKGDLSFIGPRPEMPALVSVYEGKIPYYGMRHMITPGLSGWAQINDFDVPRSGIDVERTVQKLSFDLYYLKHRSFILDLEIALKTIRALLLRSGT